MVIRSLISLSLVTVISAANDMDDNAGNASAPSVNIISSDYSETSIVEELPIESNHGDAANLSHKVKVHKSYHRKHKGLPQVVQPPTNHKIEEVSKNQDQQKAKDKLKKKLKDAELLSALQESTAYHWWLEISLQQ
jgi:hypothetical protein